MCKKIQRIKQLYKYKKRNTNRNHRHYPVSDGDGATCISCGKHSKDFFYGNDPMSYLNDEIK